MNWDKKKRVSRLSLYQIAVKKYIVWYNKHRKTSYRPYHSIIKKLEAEPEIEGRHTVPGDLPIVQLDRLWLWLINAESVCQAPENSETNLGERIAMKMNGAVQFSGKWRITINHRHVKCLSALCSVELSLSSRSTANHRLLKRLTLTKGVNAP